MSTFFPVQHNSDLINCSRPVFVVLFVLALGLDRQSHLRATCTLIKHNSYFNSY